MQTTFEENSKLLKSCWRRPRFQNDPERKLTRKEVKFSIILNIYNHVGCSLTTNVGRSASVPRKEKSTLTPEALFTTGAAESSVSVNNIRRTAIKLRACLSYFMKRVKNF